jgi:hypothetical protein
MSNAHPLKRELPDQFGADAKHLSEQELWRREVCDHGACTECGALKGAFCTRKSGAPALRCHSVRSREFVRYLKTQAKRRGVSHA